MREDTSPAVRREAYNDYGPSTFSKHPGTITQSVRTRRTDSISRNHLPHAGPSVSPVSTLSRGQSYIQPAGTASRERSMHRDLAASRPRSGSSGSLNRASEKTTGIYCDVVTEGWLNHQGVLEIPRAITNFLPFLGQKIRQITFENAGYECALPPLPKQGSVDHEKRMRQIRQSLKELSETETKYYKKIRSLEKDFAGPLRSFAKRADTAVIGAYEVVRLFSNIDDLVPISEAFEADLRAIVAQIESNPNWIPPNIGDIILGHVKKMEPYRKYLLNVTTSKAQFKELWKQKGFRSYVERNQLASREATGATGGLEEFLAEPFQRLPRYTLMLQPLLDSLMAGDPNIPAVTAAMKQLSDICSMKPTPELLKAATFWALQSTIDEFPPSMYSAKRPFVTALDVDEHLDTSTGGTVLRASLLLFTDCILIVKRGSSDRGTLEITGLDNRETLAHLYNDSNSNAETTIRGIPGTPRKLRKGILSCKGKIYLEGCYTVDLGADELGFVMENAPYDVGRSWDGRPTRKYVVSSTYPPGTRQHEKERFLRLLEETKGSLKTFARPLKSTRVGVRQTSNGKESKEEGAIVYSSVMSKIDWEHQGHGKAPLAIQLVSGNRSEPLHCVKPPSVVMRVELTYGNYCEMSVLFADGSVAGPEKVALDCVVQRIATIAMSYNLYPFKLEESKYGSLGRPRSRSGLFVNSTIEALFSSSSSVKRALSSTSTKSSIATGSSGSTSIMGSWVKRRSSSRSKKEGRQVRDVRDVFSSDPASHREFDADVKTSEVEALDEGSLLSTPIPDRRHHRRSQSAPAPDLSESQTHPSFQISPQNYSPVTIMRQISTSHPHLSTQPDSDSRTIDSPIERPRSRLRGPRPLGEGSPLAKSYHITPPSPVGVTPSLSISRLARAESPTPAHVPRPLSALSTRDYGESMSTSTSVTDLTNMMDEQEILDRDTSSSVGQSACESSYPTPYAQEVPINKRPYTEAMSPRQPPAKKTSPGIGHGAPPRTPMDSLRVKLEDPARNVSESTLKESSRISSLVTDNMMEFDGLERKLADLRVKISMSENKENQRHTGGLSRSHATRNVYLKANGINTSPDRPVWAEVNIRDLLKAVDGVSQQVSVLRSKLTTPAVEGPSQIEYDLLVSEKELLQESLSDKSRQLEASLQDLQVKDTKIEQLAKQHQVVIAEFNDVYASFEEEINAVAQSLSAPLSARESELFTQLRDTLTKQGRLESACRQMDTELAEKNRILREHGLL